MHENGKKLLSLMFKEGETVCVSNAKYSYHSLSLENILDNRVVLLSPNPSAPIRKADSSELIFVALNPIKGFREDANCTSFRNFLIEIDTGPLAQQLDFIKKLGMPYSAAVFSGNKSIHFLISLSEDLPNIKIYKKMGKWILNIITLADQNTFYPSISIRIPGAVRSETGKAQQLVDFKGKVSISELSAWLAKHPSAKPKEYVKKPLSEVPDFDRISPWVIKKLRHGLDKNVGRNKQWFSIAANFAQAGYDEDDIISILSKYFQEESDFEEKEFLTAIASGYRHIHSRE